jgi:hypothetical protein
MSTDLPGLVIDIEARVDKFERALEEKFKPALAKAIGEVVETFFAENTTDFIELKEVAE